ncbi:uncharacterized protein LOC128867668 isoform X3 [Anastrepha ludens]|uniref:uncharacterized protein LOC128867668 isoform X3 n=1 Tax=Anastrepha ludens TaxID=28586 RepID=UPI0023AF8345|nr:uncharacterized protein LOC128867668 isoform X3 [Anastrepha ludens]
MGATTSVEYGAVIKYDNSWVHSSPYQPVPPFAVIGGHDCDGSPIYVGRSYHEGDNLPAKVVPSKGTAYVCWGGQEITKSHYEILVGQGYAWVPCYGGSVPPNAVRTGTTRMGEPLYVGRGHHANSLTVGKIHPSHGCLYIPFGGHEVRIGTYEVLIKQTTDQWVPATPNYAPPNAVAAGYDTDRAPIYVARAMHEGELLPAKFVPNKNCAYVCCGGYEINKISFDVLCGMGYSWVHVYNHAIPPNAVFSGVGRNGQRLYVGRGHHHGSLTPGLVSQIQRCLFIPYGGREIRVDSYEVLCRQ